ncbi:HAD-IA family hydrolase [Gordonia amarae]|uniref:HAD-IA family hydrolase n=1 Tax=Gordonia amarae TaxID=36821 RepID=A0A857L368_9ACTN|nr:HAD-IA family hydrolase [Gordonia amarae]QHN22627.1 HAD-IA family hydrolase [Gordonia amarae]QHN31493.1 HAD-IA family hydrolase [Gordonia amarae]QHN40237.1 HAD-IA family hydrolase [Gordonia amarae]
MPEPLHTCTIEGVHETPAEQIPLAQIPPRITEAPSAGAQPADPGAALLLDLDGTLTDSFAGIANSFAHALDVMGLPPAAPEVIAGVAGPPLLDTLHAMGLDEPTADATMTAYRARYSTVGYLENSVFAGIGPLLADLAAAGRRMAVATSKNQATAIRILEHFGLSEYFELIAGASDDGTRRSKADVIAYALAGLGVEVDATGTVSAPVVMVGDRSHDIEGAAEFGIPTVHVEWGYALDGEAGAAAWIVRSVPELRTLLGV